MMATITPLMNENPFEEFGIDGSMTNIDVDTILKEDINTSLSDNWFDTLPVLSDTEDFALDKLFSEPEQSETESVVEEQTTEEKADHMMATMGEFDMLLEPSTGIERASSLTLIDETNTVEYDADHDCDVHEDGSMYVSMYDTDEEIAKLADEEEVEEQVEEEQSEAEESEVEEQSEAEESEEEQSEEESDAETESDNGLNESQGDASLVQECTICMKETENYTEEGRCMSCAKKIELEVAKKNEVERKREAKRRMREAIAERTSNKWKRKRNENGDVDANDFCCHAPGCNEVFRKKQDLVYHLLLPGRPSRPGHDILHDPNHPLRMRDGKQFIEAYHDPYNNKCELCDHGEFEGFINRHSMKRHYRLQHPHDEMPAPKRAFKRRRLTGKSIDFNDMQNFTNKTMAI